MFFDSIITCVSFSIGRLGILVRNGTVDIYSHLSVQDEIHSLTLANQNIKQELQISQSQCNKYEQELGHNQMIIKAAREQVVNLLDRHKQNRVETNSCSYRFDQVCDTSASGEWINQATNLQQVLSMATDNRYSIVIY